MPSKKPNPEGKVLTKDPTKGKKKTATPKKRKPHYVDNKRFLESIIAVSYTHLTLPTKA